MLSRRIRGGYVCLRCQLSLASPRRTVPFRPSLQNPALHNAPSRRAYSDAADSSKSQDGSFESRFDPERKDSPPNRAQNGVSEGKQRPEELSFRRVAQENTKTRGKRRSLLYGDDKPRYSSKGQRLEPTDENLPIQILGKPAHAIVMRDVGPRTKRVMRQLIEAADAAGEGDKKGGEFSTSAGQDDAPSLEEALKNIDELRPKTNVVPKWEFDALRKKVTTGFTKAQLATYLTRQAARQKKAEKKEGKTKTKGKGQSPWLLEQMPWAPENQTSGTADALLEGYLTKSSSPKDRLAIGLMRRCWGLGTEELQNRVGHLDVKVKDLQFELLMSGNKRWLSHISRTLSEAGTQIELLESEKVVRITAPKATAEHVLDEIHALLNQAETRLLDVSKITPEHLDQAALEQVGKMTKTVVQPTKTGSMIQVAWMPLLDPVEDGLETPGDVVYRLLLTGYGFQNYGESRLVVHPEEHSLGGWYIQDNYSKSKMAWRDRLSDWGRWTMPTAIQGGRHAMTYEAELPATILSHPPADPSADAAPPTYNEQDGWSSQPQVTTRAIFGHVLHKDSIQRRSGQHAEHTEEPVEESTNSDALPTVEAFVQRKERSRPALERSRNMRDRDIHDKFLPELSRTLAPTIPPLQSLAALTKTSKHTTPSESTILMRFLPIPNGSNSPILPSLELTLTYDPSNPDAENVSIKSLTATTSVDNHDILLPSRPVDIRLQHTTTFTLPGDSIPSHLPQLTDFISESHIRPSDGVLLTPSRFESPLAIPARLLPSPQPQEPVKARYVFAGLEIRRSVATEVDGWRLVYTSIEAGQGGGRRAELSLEGVRMDSGQEEEGQGGDAKFVETLNKLTVGGGLRWYGEGQKVRGEGEKKRRWRDEGKREEERER